MPTYNDIVNCQSIDDLLQWSAHPDHQGLDVHEVLSEFNQDNDNDQSDQAQQSFFWRRRPQPRNLRLPSWVARTSQLQEKPAIVLDIDETLGHSFHSSGQCKETTGCKPDLKLEFSRGNAYYFKCRPFLQKFLSDVSKWYEIWIFTAGTQNYGEKIAKGIEKLYGQNFFGRPDARRVFGRKYCTRVRGVGFVKDLRKFHRRPICIVDNSKISKTFQPTLGIDIESWYGKGDQKYDSWLYDYLPYLKKLSTEKRFSQWKHMIKKINCEVNGSGANKSRSTKRAADNTYCGRQKGVIVKRDDSTETSTSF